MKRKLLWFLISVFVVIVSFILVEVSSVNLYDMKEPLFLMDNGFHNELNQDNEIFKTHCTFVYKVSFSDSLGRAQFVCLEPDFTGVKSNLIPQSERLIHDKYCIDYVKLQVYGNKGSTQLGETQTIVKYDFFHGGRRVFFGEKTGVIEDSLRIFLHPPRSHFFFYNQFNPFPYVKFPILDNKYWELEFRIPDHALERIPRLKNSTLRLTYSMVGMEQYESPWGTENVYRFLAKGLNDEIETKSIYLFSKKYGFLKMEFYTVDGIKIVMDLEDIN
jgi:hypothetical protein